MNNGIFFQAVARDNYSNPAKDRKIYVQTSIIQGSETGVKVLIEDHQTNTDATGVFGISIGLGTRKGGTVANLNAVEWTKGPYYLNLKIAISPVAPAADWDYTKEWIDLGTTAFGTVPYALFAGSVAGFDTKLNSIDTAKMLLPYARVANLNTLVTNKVNVADSITKYVTPTQLASKTFDSTAIYRTIGTKLNIADSITKYVTPTQLAAKTFDSTAIYNQLALKANTTDVNTSLALKANTTDVTTSLNLKENLNNKSIDVSADGTSDTKYPSAKAVKTFVENSITNSTVPDATALVKGKIQLTGDLTGTSASPSIATGAVTTSKINDGAVTDAKVATVSGSKVTGNISGNAANITGNLAIVNGGTGATSAAGARTNLGLVIGTDVQAPLSFSAPINKNGNTVSINQATTSVDGYLSAADFTSFNNKIDATQKAANNGVATLGNDGKIPSNQIPAISFQSANVVADQNAMLAISGAQVGSIAIRTDNNRNYVLSALPASTLSNWVQLAVPSSVTSVNGSAGPNVVLTTNDVAEGSTNKYYTDARVRGAINASTPLSFNSSTGTISMTAASASSNGYLTSTDFNTFNNKQNAITAGVDYLAPNGSAANLTNFPTLNQSTTGNAATATRLATSRNINGVGFDGTANITVPADGNTLTGSSLASNITSSSLTSVGAITSGVWSGSTIAVAKGGTGATTANAALTNLGAEPTANKSTATDLGALNPSDVLFPSQKAVKTYVDLQSANAGVADGSITNAKLAGSITANKLVGTDITTVGTITTGTWSGSTIAINKGGTGATTAAGARTNLGLVIGTDVMAANATTTLTGDITGTGSGTFTTTLSNSGVTAGTYGSSTAIPVVTVDAKGRVTSASEVGIIAGVNTLTYTTGTSYANGGTVSGTTLTLAAADGTNPGLISTASQTIAGAKTFSSNVTAPTFVGNLSGNATTATTAGNITATSNTTLTSLANLNTVGTITSGTWSGSTVAIEKGGTGATTAAGARTNLGLVIGTDVMAANATTTLTGDVTGTGSGTFTTTLSNSGVTAGTYGSSTAIPTITVDAKGRVTSASTVGIIAGVNTLTYTTGTSYTNGGIVSGTTLTLAAADGSNPGLISTGAQTIAGAKTFSNTTTFNTDVTLNGLTLGKGRNSNTGNVALGSSVLSSNTTGNYNTAIGNKALMSNLSGGSNTGIGHFALYYNETGSSNTAVGSNALNGSVSGNSNSAFGSQAIPSINGGTGNTSIGSGSFYNLTSGTNNIALGYNAGQYYTGSNLNLTNANNGIFIGTNTRAGVNSSTNEIVIGNQLLGNGSNTVTIGNSSITDNYFNGNINLTGNINGGTWSGTTISIVKGGTGATTAADARTNLGLVIGTDVMAANATTTLTGDITGTGSGTFTTTLANSGVTANTYGSSTAIPVLTVDAKGRVTSAAEVGIIAGVNTLTYTSGTTYANGGIVSGTTLTLAAADGNNPGLISTGAQTIAGAKTFSSNVTASTFVGNLSGTANTAINIAGGVSGSIPYQTAAGTTAMIPNGQANQILTATGSGTYTWTSVSNVTGNSVPYTGATGAVNLGAYDLTVNGLTVGTGVNGSTLSNTAFGYNALAGNNSGLGKNTAIGYSALNKNTSGQGNTAVGYNALLNQTGNVGSTAIGTQALEKNIANGNTAVGNGAGYWLDNSLFSYNSFFGYNAGARARGANNIGIGNLALQMNNSGSSGTGGDNNIAIGNNTLATSSRPVSNVVIGDNAGYGFTYGSWNTIVGQKSGYNITEGYHNTIIGDSTGQGITTGSNNVIIGSKVSGLSSTLTGNIILADGAGNIRAQHDGTNGWNLGTITSGTWSGTAIAIANGGTGSNTAAGARTNLGLGSLATKSTIANADIVSGAAIDFAKLNITKADITGLGVQEGLTAGSGISISSGTISVTGLTSSNLSSTAGITNAQLANSSTTLGSTTMTLGGTVTSVTGLTSVNTTNLTATNITGTLSGTATGLATGRTISTTGDVTYTSGAFDGTANVTGTATLTNTTVTNGSYGSSTAIPTFTVDSKGRLTAASTASIIADAGTLTGTTLNSTVTSSSLTGVGTITSGTWNASTISAARGGTGLTSPGTSGNILTSNGTTWVSSPISAVTGLGTFTTTSYANGGTLSGTNTLLLSAADATNPGLLTAGTQVIGGAKTFSGTYTLNVPGTGYSNMNTLKSISFQPRLIANDMYIDLVGVDISPSFTVYSSGTTTNKIGLRVMGSSIVSTGNTTDNSNTVLGLNALGSATTGANNTAFGWNALTKNTTGSSNTAIGISSLSSTLTGTSNVALGSQALRLNLASENTSIGTNALQYSTNSRGNIAIGHNAAIDFGNNYLTATYNTNSGGSGNIFIGYNVHPLNNNGSNEIVIGSGLTNLDFATGLGSNTTSIGSTSTQQSRIYGALTVVPNSASSSMTGTSSTISAQSAVTPGFNGGDLNLNAGNGVAPSGRGGNVILTPGSGGTAGQVQLAGTTMVTGATTISNTTTSSSATTGALIVSGGTGIAGNANIGGTLGVTGASTLTGVTTITNTTTSTSTTTGALVVRGGVGVAGNLTVGGTIEIDGGSPGVGKVLTSDANGLASWTSNPNTAIISITSSTTYTIATDDKYVIYSNGTTGTITLPSASVVGAGKEYIIKNISPNSITVNTTGSQNIIVDNATNTATTATLGIEASNNWIRVISDGTRWIGFRALF